MAEKRGPSARARQLARELRRLRTESGRTGEEVAAELGWSSAKISRVETARTAISVADLRRLLAVYQVNENLVERLAELARKAREKGWWSAYSDGFPESYATLFSLEDEARRISAFQMSCVNGLLQTEDYTRAIFQAKGPLPHGELERRVRIRKLRQKILEGPEVPDYRIVLDEAVLHRKIGENEIMRRQLEHLMEMAGAPNLTLQVLPSDVGAHGALAGSFVIFGFSHPDDPRSVTVETLVGNLIIEDDVEVFQYTLVFEELQGIALAPEASLELIEQISRNYD